MFPSWQIEERHRRILALIRENTGRLILAGLCSLLVGLTTTAMGYLIKPVIDDIFVSKSSTGLVMLPFAIMFVFLFRGLGQYGQQFFLSFVGEDVIRQLRNQLYDRIQDLPISFFQKERTGVLISRITNDVTMLKTMVSTAVSGVLQDTFSIIGLTAVIFHLNWRMAILALIVLPLAFFPIFKLGRRVRKISKSCQTAIAELTAFLHETLAGTKIVKAFGMEGHEKKRFFTKTGELFKLEIKSVRVRAISSPLMEIISGIGIAFVIWFGGWEVLRGETTAGEFLSFLSCVILLYGPVKKLSHLNNSIQQGLAATDRIYDVIETQSDIRDPDNPRPIPQGTHSIHFKDVRFSYGEKPVLQGIDLAIKGGSVLALVGMSGGGKTTIANLIPRFFDVSGGSICLDGIDIRQFKVDDLRKQIAIVTQEPILFNETVRENILYGNPQAPDQAIRSAAQAAYAHDFIERFPRGYDTVIGELGGRLSGGEKQRLCIARALLKDAPILILDEATSALDAEAEGIVQKALENLMRGRTTIVIAHRLSTIAGADQIAVVVDGRIIEIGTHSDLMVRNGEYTKLYERISPVN
ncbi:MAG: ABC transporter ATP-binding protein [Desulfobacteraceae bacterium]|nr:MAG: ABC transporter ATP-binding protein [Desulfobacteraceae bacterium]